MPQFYFGMQVGDSPACAQWQRQRPHMFMDLNLQVLSASEIAVDFSPYVLVLSACDSPGSKPHLSARRGLYVHCFVAFFVCLPTAVLVQGECVAYQYWPHFCEMQEGFPDFEREH